MIRTAERAQSFANRHLSASRQCLFTRLAKLTRRCSVISQETLPMNSENPYQPPNSDVTPISEPLSLPPPPFRRSFLLVGGWLSLLLWLLTIPYTAEAFVPALFPTAVSVALTVSVTLLSMFVLYVLIRYLEYRYETKNFRTLFYVLLALGAVSGVLNLLDTGSDPDEFSLIMLIGVIALPIYGIPYTMLGFRIKRYAKDAPLLIALAWLTIVSGILMSTIIFAPLIFPIGLVSGLLWTLALFSAARELSQAGYD